MSQRELPFDKYDFYMKAVQSPEGDVDFFRDTYHELKKKSARILREDFCGTAALCTAWVEMNPNNSAIGVDLDPEPLEYGRKKFWENLNPSQQKRLQMIRANVLSKDLPKADLSVALNFSYFLFKSRPQIKAYFKNVYARLNKDGIAMFDAFGGSQCQDSIEDKVKHRQFTYYWDQKGFDPITNEAKFAIHFRVNGKKHEDVFTYDWRLWTLPELREILAEVGFKKTHIYWEGTARDGSGNGKFTRVTEGEACLSWIAYLVAEK